MTLSELVALAADLYDKMEGSRFFSGWRSTKNKLKLPESKSDPMIKAELVMLLKDPLVEASTDLKGLVTILNYCIQSQENKEKDKTRILAAIEVEKNVYPDFAKRYQPFLEQVKLFISEQLTTGSEAKLTTDTPDRVLSPKSVLTETLTAKEKLERKVAELQFRYENEVSNWKTKYEDEKRSRKFSIEVLTQLNQKMEKDKAELEMLHEKELAKTKDMVEQAEEVLKEKRNFSEIEKELNVKIDALSTSLSEAKEEIQHEKNNYAELLERFRKQQGILEEENARLLEQINNQEKVIVRQNNEMIGLNTSLNYQEEFNKQQEITIQKVQEDFFALQKRFEVTKSRLGVLEKKVTPTPPKTPKPTDDVCITVTSLAPATFPNNFFAGRNIRDESKGAPKQGLHRRTGHSGT